MHIACHCESEWTSWPLAQCQWLALECRRSGREAGSVSSRPPTPHNLSTPATSHCSVHHPSTAAFITTPALTCPLRSWAAGCVSRHQPARCHVGPPSWCTQSPLPVPGGGGVRPGQNKSAHHTSCLADEEQEVCVMWEVCCRGGTGGGAPPVLYPTK
jgi:hypothetical protein